MRAVASSRNRHHLPQIARAGAGNNAAFTIRSPRFQVSGDNDTRQAAGTIKPTPCGRLKRRCWISRRQVVGTSTQPVRLNAEERLGSRSADCRDVTGDGLGAVSCAGNCQSKDLGRDAWSCRLASWPHSPGRHAPVAVSDPARSWVMAGYGAGMPGWRTWEVTPVHRGGSVAPTPVPIIPQVSRSPDRALVGRPRTGLHSSGRADEARVPPRGWRAGGPRRRSTGIALGAKASRRLRPTALQAGRPPFAPGAAWMTPSGALATRPSRAGLPADLNATVRGDIYHPVVAATPHLCRIWPFDPAALPSRLPGRWWPVRDGTHAADTCPSRGRSGSGHCNPNEQRGVPRLRKAAAEDDLPSGSSAVSTRQRYLSELWR